MGATLRLETCGPGEHDPSTRVAAVAAAVGGGRLGLAWLTRGAHTAAVSATFGPDSAVSFAPALQLGAADANGGHSDQGDRGQLWIAGADDERLRVAWQGQSAPCTSEHGPCAQLVSTQLPAPRPQSQGARHLDTREVPHPCPRLLLGSIWNRGVWYDAFCAREQPDGVSVTEVYAIRPEIFYAEVSPLLQDCAPLGIAPSSSGAVVFGQCGDSTRVQRLGGDHPAQVVLEGVTRALHCQAGRPTLTLTALDGAVEEYRLTGPRDRLEMWLPADIAGPGSRAAFTGRRLLVAHTRENRLLLDRYRCEGETVVSDAPAML